MVRITDTVTINQQALALAGSRSRLQSAIEAYLHDIGCPANGQDIHPIAYAAAIERFCRHIVKSNGFPGAARRFPRWPRCR